MMCTCALKDREISENIWRLGAVGVITGLLLFTGDGVKHDEAPTLCYILVQMKLVAIKVNLK